MKRCLAGRIRQGRETEIEKRGRRRDRPKGKKHSESETVTKRSKTRRGKQRPCKKGGKNELRMYMRRKMQDKGKYVWGKKKSYQKNFFSLLEHLSVTAG